MICMRQEGEDLNAIARKWKLMTGHKDGPRHLEYRCRQVRSSLGLHTDKDIECVLIAEATEKSKEELDFDPKNGPDEPVEVAFDTCHQNRTNGKLISLTLDKQPGSAAKTKWVRLKIPLRSIEGGNVQAPTQFDKKLKIDSLKEPSLLPGSAKVSRKGLLEGPSGSSELKLICKSQTSHPLINRLSAERSLPVKGHSVLTQAELEKLRKRFPESRGAGRKGKIKGKFGSLNAHGQMCSTGRSRKWRQKQSQAAKTQWARKRQMEKKDDKLDNFSGGKVSIGIPKISRSSSLNVNPLAQVLTKEGA